MEDVLDVYQRPLDPARPVVCMDETSKQLVAEVRQPLPAKPPSSSGGGGGGGGRVERFDYEYKRNGVANIFMAFEPLAGRRLVRVTDRRTRRDWGGFIRELVDEVYPAAEKIVLVMDNLNTHSAASLYETFEPEEARRLARKLEIHYTPKHASWLNVAEIELSVLARQCLQRRVPDKATLEREIERWSQERNNEPAPIDWRFTAEDARIKLKRLYPAIQP